MEHPSTPERTEPRADPSPADEQQHSGTLAPAEVREARQEEAPDQLLDGPSGEEVQASS